jgi:hypothetical protein
VYRIDVTFNFCTALADESPFHAMAARVLHDLFVQETTGDSRATSIVPLRSVVRGQLDEPLAAVLAVWFTMRVPEPKSDVVAILCIDEFTKVPRKAVRDACSPCSEPLSDSGAHALP